MPLLKDQPFIRTKLSPSLHPNDEVFFCGITTEAFTNYEDYFEKAILCSSMQWTCAVTGKQELTFQEAVASEAAASETMDSLSLGLQRALLHLSIVVNTTHFNDICHFLYIYSAKRFFVDETLIATTMFGKKEANVVRVIAPSRSTLESASDDVAFGVDPELYKYEIVNSDPSSGKFRMVVGPDRLSRPKNLITRDKIKLFLKYHTVITKRGKYTEVKESSKQKFGLNNVSWERVFSGPLPNLDPEDDSLPSQYKLKSRNPDQRNSNGEERRKPGPKPLSEEEKKRRMEEKRQAQNDAKKSARQKAREEKARLERMEKEKNRKREDFECDDSKPLPLGMPISCPIPQDIFGDALLILEFFNNFDEFFDLKEIFPHGFTFELLVKCLTEKSIKSCISDLLRITLATLFCLQEDEPSESTNEAKSSDEPDGNEDENKWGDSLKTAVRMANIANSTLKSLIGSKLSNMKMNAFTITEVVRQHLLTSGSFRQRNVYRGWYSTREDPALNFKIEHPDLLDKLSRESVYDLEPQERVGIFTVLIHEIMSFPAFRDILENKIESIVELRKELRSSTADFARWERESLLAVKQKNQLLSSETNDNSQSQTDSQHEVDVEKFTVEKEKRSAKLEQLHARLRQKIRTHEAQYGVKPLGRDRAFRRYWVFNSLPGLLVERDDQLSGPCIVYKTCQSASPANNKENEFDPRPRKSSISSSSSVSKKSTSKSMECTGNERTCPIHSSAESQEKWTFYTSQEDVEQLIASLNEKGFRESELKKVLEKDKEFVFDSISKCPMARLNTNLTQEEGRMKRLVYYRPSDHIQYEDRTPQEGLLLSFMELLETYDEQLYASGLTFRLNASMSHDEWKACLRRIDASKTNPRELSSLLVKLAQNIVSQHLNPPLGGDNGSMNKWIEIASELTCLPQLFFLLDVLDCSVNWSQSALSAFCRVCKRKKDAANMLICDSCNRGHHTYCLKPPLDSIPTGEWFCLECKPKAKTPRKQPPRTVKNDDDMDEQDSISDQEAGDTTVDDGGSSTEVSETEEEDSQSCSSGSQDVCVVCSSHDDDADVECNECHKKYHMSCHPTKVTSRRNFVCFKCSNKSKSPPEKRKEESLESQEERPKRKRVLRAFTDDDEEPNRTTSGRRKEFVDLIVCSDLFNKFMDHKTCRALMKQTSEKSGKKLNPDLTAIERNLKAVTYKTNKEFVQDVRRVLRNNDHQKSGKELSGLFEDLVCKMLPQLAS